MPARPVSPHLDLGRRGEDEAAKLLVSKGYRILERNVRLGRGEIDLVCKRRGVYVFVEVKTRGPGSLASPHDGLSRTKCRTLAQAAGQWLSEHDQWRESCRFDFVSVLFDGESYTLEHVENAFDLSSVMGGGDASWQPW